MSILFTKSVLVTLFNIYEDEHITHGTYSKIDFIRRIITKPNS